MNNAEMPNPFDEDPPSETPSTYATSSLRPIEEDNSGYQIIWLILGIAAIGCGIIFTIAFFLIQPNTQSLVSQLFQSPTPTLTPTPTPNLTATASMFQSTAVSAQSQWGILLKETFDNNYAGWYVGTDDNQYDKVTYTVKDGKYHWDTTAHKGFIQWIRLSEKSYTDFYVSAEVQEVGKNPAGDCGIIFREDKPGNHYYFAVTQNGSFFCFCLLQ